MAAVARFAPGPTSTRTYASIITWKQTDVLLCLDAEGWNEPDPHLTAREIEESLASFINDDYYEGTVRYFSPNAYSTLRTLEARGMVARDDEGKWYILEKGKRVLWDK
jgi:hypothetical protein